MLQIGLSVLYFLLGVPKLPVLGQAMRCGLLNALHRLEREMQRSLKSFYNRYYAFVLPILKTHTSGLPMKENWMWQKYLMLHIIERKIENWKDINYHELVTVNSFVGQTYQSLKVFAKDLTRVVQNNVKVLANDNLWKKAEKSYYEQSLHLLLFNERLQEKKLERIQNIIEAYESSKK